MKQQWRIAILSVSACILLIVHRYPGQPAFFDAHLARGFLFNPANELYRWLYSFAATFIVLGLLPAALGCFLWNERPSEWGLTLGRRKLFGLVAALLLCALSLPLLHYVSGLPHISAGHPLCRLAANHRAAFIIYEGFLVLAIVGREFVFRGFLLFGLKKHVGEAAVYLQLVPYVVLHFGKPPVEVLGAIPAGVILGHLASFTGSVWYGILLHSLWAVALDAFIVIDPF
ncbi:MAG: CPBP family intramembrane metalloprotease [Candidatus Abyssobacteria bacterium SURF_17]|uniref:CPBP family intramembrane metalloprotease n=1 Tax=Candidatus Abyssobacteria bacterium SURF_17 TaxID=2093361 RepID=A0A419ETV9_9BACT|nr:MAG: CPBP family intramembrane metalloprotease [Candidatus Abyssubacteria bacterium SURF_17]